MGPVVGNATVAACGGGNCECRWSPSAAAIPITALRVPESPVVPCRASGQLRNSATYPRLRRRASIRLMVPIPDNDFRPDAFAAYRRFMAPKARTLDKQLTAPRLQEIGRGVFAYVQPDGGWWVNNTGFLVSVDGVVSIDTCATVRRTAAYQQAIRSVTPVPVRTVVNTHHHGDHTFGNFMFGDATIVAHDKTRRALLDWGTPRSAPYWTDVEWDDVRLAPPFLTFPDRMTLWHDDHRSEVAHVGQPAHTTNDSIVWLPDRRILFAGDLLFNGGTPFLLEARSPVPIAVLRDVISPLGAKVIVPGHGEVAGPGLIGAVLSYLEFVQRVAREAHAAGLSPLEAARETDLGPYAELLDSERIVGNLHRAYAELTGGSVDAFAALADMVAYHGGPLHTVA
jgi:cyclase